MKLNEISSAMLAQAIEAYLDVAYARQPPPERVLAIGRVDPSAPLEAALERDCVERVLNPTRPGFIDKYRWRLGNTRYLHMKLGVERCSDADDFVFTVDTHDRDFPVGSPGLQSREFRDLVSHNAEVKSAIEARWQGAGLPTFPGHITERLHKQCPIERAGPKTVLIVDDEEAILELERTFVGEAGYRAVSAASGAEALALLGELDTVDLCLVDVMMPFLDGLTLARTLRSLNRPRFPIICVTALPGDRVPPGVADGYVGKPFDPDHLLEVIRHHIG